MSLLSKLFCKQKPSLSADIQTGAEWISEALKSSGYDADFSLKSLKEIDRFFDEQNTPGGLLSADVGKRLFAIGAYIGEVLIKQYGGSWIVDDEDPQGEMNIAVELSNGSLVYPVQKAMKRYSSGAEEGIYDYAVILGNERQRLISAQGEISLLYRENSAFYTGMVFTKGDL